ncbi:MAG: carboxylating nicotinate-nucleotide diphosphorylase [Pseudomonadota bacterium]
MTTDSAILPPPRHIIEEAVARALQEDLGLAGDVTTAACIPENARSKAAIVARRPGVIAGLALAQAAFRQTDPTIQFEPARQDGARVKSGEALAVIEGPSRGVLTGERVALNFLGRLSGVATATAQLVDAVAHTTAKIACTRKTTPGLRALEKYAVRCGGGVNHRFGLFDAVMIKDNHIAAAGGIVAAAKTARDAIPHTMRIEIEVDRLDQLEEALSAGADIILLDNMAPPDLTRAVDIAAGRAVLEASGNVTLETVAAIAETGIDVISSGAITHSAPCLDLGLDFLSE